MFGKRYQTFSSNINRTKDYYNNSISNINIISTFDSINDIISDITNLQTKLYDKFSLSPTVLYYALEL